MIDLVTKIICDEIGCPITDDFPYHDSDYWESDVEESARHAGWQCTGESDWCPNHWHVCCIECMTWQVGNRKSLEYYGWTRIRNDSDNALCPECSKRMKGIGK